MRTAATFLTSLVLASCAPASSAQDDVLPGRTVYIVDGDTADVLLTNGNKIRVRLHGIDTPETTPKRQPYGAEVEALLGELMADREVEIQVVDQDRDGRFVSRVYVDGVDVNAELIKRGAAYAERRYLRQVEDGETYCLFEHAARSSKLGIWNLPADQRIAPWEFRDGVEPATDYANETAKACVEAIGASRAVARRSARVPVGPDGAPSFTCGETKTCKQVATCDEALFRLQQCAASALDRDKDGTPCEDLCR